MATKIGSIDNKNKIAALKAFYRANALPLDTSDVWTSYDEALEYVQDKNSSAYVGQILTVVDSNCKCTPYIVEGIVTNGKLTDGKLVKITTDGGTMTDRIRFTYPQNEDKTIISVDGGTDGEYGFRFQYDGKGEGNNNSLSLIADNQNGNEVNAMKVFQDGNVTFSKNITASKFVGPLEGNADTATTATALSSSDGSATKPVYFKDGKPKAINYTIEKSVPSDAKFTDTTYTFDGAVSTIKDDNLTASRALISNSSGKVAVSAVTSTELGYLDGVTSNVQDQLNGKQSTIAGAASSITDSNLTIDRVLVSNTSGKVAVHTITGTKLGYLSNVTSDIQTQINNRAPAYDFRTDDPGSGSSLEHGKLCFIYEYE